MSKERKIRNWVRSLMMKHELGTITNQLMELIVPSEEIDKVELTIELTASRESQECSPKRGRTSPEDRGTNEYDNCGQLPAHICA